METITFYSYKGGVGRTLALANIAVYLSRFGQNICVVDFDLEAPGVHYKLQRFFPTPIKLGLVDYIYEFTSLKKIPKSLDRFVLKAVNIPKSQGDISFIPAGNVLSSEYWQKLASIDWHSLFYKEGGEGIPFFLELKERIRKELKPDFLLIDSRTGITEMSGLCTSLLPDKVVFLIINNPENIEGSRQILRGIQKAKRLKGQKSIEVVFALTRIPTPGNDNEIKNERRIIEDIKNFLNENTENLNEQLYVSEIYVLHSDRELELSESLRLNKLNIKEIPLAKDYLKVFSKNLLEKIIELKIERIEKSIAVAEKPSEEMIKIQEELETLSNVYPHSKTFEKLIDFYMSHKAEKEKIMEAFADLWEISKKLSNRMYLKFIEIFKKTSFKDIDESHLDIVEAYLKSNLSRRIEVDLKLADAYNAKGIYEKALRHYFRLIDQVKNQNLIIEKIFNILIEKDDYEDACRFLEDYYKPIVKNPSLVIKALLVLSKIGKREEIKKLFENGDISENLLLEYDPFLFFNIMNILERREDEIYFKLEIMVDKALKNKNTVSLKELGKIFYISNRADKFKKIIPDDFPEKKSILFELGRELFSSGLQSK
ncbi:MAG: AAA family ATPase [Candidatus Aminicenantes bacterium]|nr:AAA family ATPase [Candidatus Aminicenantes bacterium]NIM78066.1 AAA family ATPase [Candidatus Aminicenantes bacterium]NIN17383.1 AAA family ATPase [Candidatus Aminicenantes bacterium]NIN41276.1 AAA family ATPase [Candidatus Aminicenantes bacterium]NIN84049.1 AAA family ATPase [Candidatus Aminicenantes bacterium]